MVISNSDVQPASIICPSSPQPQPCFPDEWDGQILIVFSCHVGRSRGAQRLLQNTLLKMADPLSEKVVQPAVNPSTLAYCPTMDLIALATVDNNIQVYRLNGQRVFGIHNKPASSSVCRIKWKPNGKIIHLVHRHLKGYAQYSYL